MNRCDGLEAIGASRLEEGGRTAPRPYAKPGAAMRLPQRKEVGAVAAGLEVAPCDPPCAQPRVPLRPQRLKEATTTQLAVGLGMKRPYTTVNAAEHAYLPEAEPGFPWRTDKEPGSYGVPVRPTGIFTQALLSPAPAPCSRR